MAAEGLPKPPTGSATAIATDKAYWSAVQASDAWLCRG
jgi:hypothetical protein